MNSVGKPFKHFVDFEKHINLLAGKFRSSKMHPPHVFLCFAFHYYKNLPSLVCSKTIKAKSFDVYLIYCRNVVVQYPYVATAVIGQVKEPKMVTQAQDTMKKTLLHEKTNVTNDFHLIFSLLYYITKVQGIDGKWNAND